MSRLHKNKQYYVDTDWTVKKAKLENQKCQLPIFGALLPFVDTFTFLTFAVLCFELSRDLEMIWPESSHHLQSKPSLDSVRLMYSSVVTY